MKPSISDFKHVSIFVYEGSGASPKSTILNRTRKYGGKLFYTDLRITGSVNRAGTASFTVTNVGDATDDERGLFSDELVATGTATTQKYIAIIAGKDIIWSGKILRSISVTQPLFVSTATFSQWNVECESDIGKMKLQVVSDTSIGSVTGTVGEVVSWLVTNASSTDIDWTGLIVGSSPPIWESVISNEGGQITFNILDSDMYSQFITLSKLSGFEWRTRLKNYVGSYGTSGWDGSTITNADSKSFYPYDATDTFKGKFVLFLYDAADSGTPNTWGVNAYGICTGSTSTSPGVITLGSIVNGSMAPTSDGWFIVLLDPVLDLSWDLEQETPVQTIRVNGVKDTTNSFCYQYNDKTDKKLLATKVTVKAKNIDASFSKTGASESIYSTLYSFNEWEPEATMFKNSTIVTRKMDGYIDSYTAGSSDIYLLGRDYSLKAGDVFDALVKFNSSSPPVWIIDKTISSIDTDSFSADGSQTTKLTCSAPIHTSNATKYSIFSSHKTYVSDSTRLYDDVGATPVIWFGNDGFLYKTITSEGVDDADGTWISGSSTYTGDDGSAYPILPGCFAYNNLYSASSPSINSSLNLNGIIAITETVDQAITKGDLETYTTLSLINHSFYLRKASCNCFINDFLKPGERGINQLYDWQMIKEGDRVAIKVSSTDNLLDTYFDGQYKYQWEVVAWTLDCNSMIVSVELGDYEPNVFTLLGAKTAAIDRTIS